MDTTAWYLLITKGYCTAIYIRVKRVLPAGRPELRGMLFPKIYQRIVPAPRYRDR